MADAYKGADQVFKIGPAAATLTTISGAQNGLATAGIQPTAATRVIPGGGASYRQLQGVTDWSLPFTVDANSVTWALLWNKVGADLFFEWNPLGTSSGTPKVTGHGIISVPLTPSTDDVLVFDVTIEADGPLTVGSN